MVLADVTAADWLLAIVTAVSAVVAATGAVFLERAFSAKQERQRREQERTDERQRREQGVADERRRLLEETVMELAMLLPRVTVVLCETFDDERAEVDMGIGSVWDMQRERAEMLLASIRSRSGVGRPGVLEATDDLAARLAAAILDFEIRRQTIPHEEILEYSTNRLHAAVFPHVKPLGERINEYSRGRRAPPPQ